MLGTSLSPFHVLSFYLDSILLIAVVISPLLQMKKLRQRVRDLPKIVFTKQWGLGLTH